MSLNPHPSVLTTASERHRAELIALAEPMQRRRLALSRGNCLQRWRTHPWTRAAGGILVLLGAARQG